MKKELSTITLIGIDCVDLKRLKIAADICQKDFSFGAVKLLSSIVDSDPRVISIPQIHSTTEYSIFSIQEMWKYIDTEYALIFQHDGFILNANAWSDDFLHYDYIGAPWYHLGTPLVGNGGFCLRSKRLLEYIAKNYKMIGNTLHPEDGWICEVARPFLEKEGMKFAPENIAKHFSKEGDLNGVIWNGEFGFHGIKYLDISAWLDKHPEYNKYFKVELSDFTQIRRKYANDDPTVHVFLSKPIQVTNYKKIGTHIKKYDCRITEDLQRTSTINIGHVVIYKLFRISLEKVGIPSFECTVSHIEKFSSKTKLLEKYPTITITPSFTLPKWRQRLISFFGNIAFPNNHSYTILWF